MLAGEIWKRGKASARPVCQTQQMPFPEYVDSADLQGRGAIRCRNSFSGPAGTFLFQPEPVAGQRKCSSDQGSQEVKYLGDCSSPASRVESIKPTLQFVGTREIFVMSHLNDFTAVRVKTGCIIPSHAGRRIRSNLGSAVAECDGFILRVADLQFLPGLIPGNVVCLLSFPFLSFLIFFSGESCPEAEAGEAACADCPPPKRE